MITQLFIADSIKLFKYICIYKDVLINMNAIVKEVNKYNNKKYSEMLWMQVNYH